MDSNTPLTIEGIIRRYYPRYAATHRLRADVIRAAERILACRTAELGGHIARCECGHVCTIRYNSCRHRCCPVCRGGQRAEWLEKLDRELLPCDHVHVIFTVPAELNVVWQFNRRVFAGLLLTAARESLVTLLADPKYLGARPGIISALHTWGRNLSVHPHVHCLVTAGGLNSQGEFVNQQRSTLLPARVLRSVFRGILRQQLKEALDAGRLTPPAGRRTAQVHSLLNRMGRVDWNVRIEERCRAGVSIAGYLARYITGGPISNARIVAVQDDHVTFRYRDYHDGAEKHMRLTAEEFLRRWFEHVPPRGLRAMRRSGLYATAHKATRQRLRATLPEPAEPAVNPRNRLEPECCPLCNSPVRRRDEVLRPVAAVFSPRRSYPIISGQPP